MLFTEQLLLNGTAYGNKPYYAREEQGCRISIITSHPVLHLHLSLLYTDNTHLHKHVTYTLTFNIFS